MEDFVVCVCIHSHSGEWEREKDKKGNYYASDNKGNRIQEEKPVLDEDGKPVFDDNGEQKTTKSDIKVSNPTIRGGITSAGEKGMDFLDRFSGGESSSKSSSNPNDSIPNPDSNNKPDSSNKDTTNHNNSSNSNNIPNSSVNGEGSQPIKKQIDTAFRENLAKNGDALKNAQVRRDNILNNDNFSDEAKAKANADYEATRQQLGGGDFRPGSPEMPKAQEQGRFAKAIDAFEQGFASNKGALAFTAGTVAAATALFATNAGASTLPTPAPMKGAVTQGAQNTQQEGGFFDAIGDIASSGYGQIALGFNALTAGVGISEMFGGANSSMAKTMQGTMSNITDMFSGKQLGETFGTAALKKLPGVGLAMGVGFLALDFMMILIRSLLKA